MADSDINLNVKVNTKEATKALDTFSKDAKASAGDAEKSLSEVFSGINDSVFGAIKNFGGLGIAVGLVGAALGKAFEVASEIATTADEVKKVNAQFDFLAAKAGDATGFLSGAFDNLNRGLLDGEDILKSASQALVNLNIPAVDLAKNFENARRVSIGLGVDTLQAFDAINNSIATGSTKQLKALGIFIDSKQAIDDYAASLGIASKFLNETQKETAIFEAIQKKVAENFGNIDITTRSTAEEFKAFGTAVSEASEATAVIIESAFGSATRAILSRFSDILNEASTRAIGSFGSEAQKASVSVKVLALDIQDAEARVQKIQERMAAGMGFASDTEELKIAEKRLAQLRLRSDLEDENRRKLEASLSFEKQVSQERAVLTDEEKAKINELALERSKLIQKFREEEQKVTEEKIAKAATDEEFALALNERIVQQELEKQTELQALKQQFADVGLAGTEAALNAEAALITSKNNEIQKIVADRNKRLDDEKKKQQAKELADQNTFLNTAASLQNAKSKELAAIGKAAAITQIAIKTPPAVASSFEFGTKLGGPVLGFTFAGIAATAMAAQAAAIAGVPLASGITEVPRGFPDDTFRASLTSGERVVNVEQNKDLTSFLDKAKDGEDDFSEEQVSILSAIFDRLGALENQIIVNIGNREIVNEVREGIRSGRALA